MKIFFYKQISPLEEKAYTELCKKISPEKKEILLRNFGSAENSLKLSAYVFSRGYLCRALKKDNTELFIKRTSDGKPYIENSTVFFSLAHTRDAFVFAVSDQNIGVDIEREDRAVPPRITQKYFLPEEKNSLSNNSVLQIWTRKEALSKLSGKGLKDMASCNTLQTKNTLITAKIAKEYVVSAASYTDKIFEFEKLSAEKIIEAGYNLNEL